MTLRLLLLKCFTLGSLLIVVPANSASLDELVKTCRAETFCNAMATAHPTDSPQDIAENNPCFHRKVHACYSSTKRAGLWDRSYDDDLKRVILHGNFCGWRNLARNPDGSAIHWKNEEEAIAATKRTPAIDAVDEICKWHDLEYFTAPYNICDADRAFVKKMQAVAWDYSIPLTESSREMALAMAGAIKKNSKTCRLIGMMKRFHIWN